MFQQGFNHPDKSAHRFFCRGAVGGNGGSDMVQVRFMNQAEQAYFLRDAFSHGGRPGDDGYQHSAPGRN